MATCRAEPSLRGSQRPRRQRPNAGLAAALPDADSSEGGDDRLPPRKMNRLRSPPRFRTCVSASPCSSLTSLCSRDEDFREEEEDPRDGDDARDREASQHIAAAAAAAAPTGRARREASPASPLVTRRYRVKKPVMPISSYLSRARLGMSPQTRLARPPKTKGFPGKAAAADGRRPAPPELPDRSFARASSDRGGSSDAGENCRPGHARPPPLGSRGTPPPPGDNRSRRPACKRLSFTPHAVPPKSHDEWPRREPAPDLPGTCRTVTVLSDDDGAPELPLTRHKRPRRIVVTDSDDDESQLEIIKQCEGCAVTPVEHDVARVTGKTMPAKTLESDVSAEDAVCVRSPKRPTLPQAKLSELVRRSKSGWDTVVKPAGSADRNGKCDQKLGTCPARRRALAPVQPAAPGRRPAVPLSQIFASEKPRPRNDRPPPPANSGARVERRRFLLLPKRRCNDVLSADATFTPAPPSPDRAIDVRFIRPADHPSLSYDAFFD